MKKENCNQNAVTSLVMNYVPNAQLLSSVGAEMEFVLSSENSSGFESLFQEIESKICAKMKSILSLLGECGNLCSVWKSDGISKIVLCC